jgi:prephenate dehydratase
MGSAGAFADQALNRFFAGDVDKVNFPSFRDTFRSVSEGSSDYAVIPIENSLAGSVYDNYDNLSRFEDINIVGAITLRIEHSLLAIPGATLDGIKNVYSHPHGFPQCTDFLEKRPDWKLIEAESTATAALLVSQKGSVENAAIASELAARYYNLIELAAGIESNKRNYTRFVVIAHEDAAKNTRAEFEFSGDMTKASVIFTTKNKPGALYECLGVFHNLKLNLTRLESRPVHGAPWQHSFYADIDISGKAGNENAESPEGIARAKSIIEEALAELKTKTENIRLLGLYRERDC